MKGIESGRDKVKKICDILKRETLEPAQMEAKELIEQAKEEAQTIVLQARSEAEKITSQARAEIERQKTIFQASLFQACRQALEELREKIEKKLFSPAFSHLLNAPLQDGKIIVRLIEAVVQALEKEGTKGDISIYIPAAVSPHEITKLISSHILERLKEKGVLLSSLGGGIEVKVWDQNLVLDLSDEALKELIAGYIRNDFRKFIFGEE